MTEQSPQYDHIGSKYDEYSRTATLKRAERYTFFRVKQRGHSTCSSLGLNKIFLAAAGW